MSIFNKLIAKLEANNPVTPKAEEIRCPECGAVIEIDADEDEARDPDTGELWETSEKTKVTTGDDPANSPSYKDSNMNNPRSRHDAEQIIAQSLLKVSGERTHNDPELPSITAAKKAVERHAEAAKQSPVDLLSEALKQAKSEQK